MAKKHFGAGLNAVIRQAPETSTDLKQSKKLKAAKAGTKPGEIRFTFIINEADLEAVKALAHYNHAQIKDVIGRAIKVHLTEKKSEVAKALDAYRKKSPYT